MHYTLPTGDNNDWYVLDDIGGISIQAESLDCCTYAIPINIVLFYLNRAIIISVFYIG